MLYGMTSAYVDSEVKRSNKKSGAGVGMHVDMTAQVSCSSLTATNVTNGRKLLADTQQSERIRRRPTSARTQSTFSQSIG